MREKTMRELARNVQDELGGGMDFIRKKRKAKRIILFACVALGILMVSLMVWTSALI